MRGVARRALPRRALPHQALPHPTAAFKRRGGGRGPGAHPAPPLHPEPRPQPPPPAPRSKTSLNALAWASTAALIDGALADGVCLAEVFVDTVGDAERWGDRLRQRYPGVVFTVCPKADALYPIVSAASIIAKVTRDREVGALAAAAGLPLGSGYPSGGWDGRTSGLGWRGGQGRAWVERQPFGRAGSPPTPPPPHTHPNPLSSQTRTPRPG